MRDIHKQWSAVVLAALLAVAACSPVSPGSARKARDNVDHEDDPEDDHEEDQKVAHRHVKNNKAIIIRQLLPFLTTAFINAITSVIVNWFYPWKVVPPIPGRVGIAQLFGGWPPLALKHAVLHGPPGGGFPPGPSGPPAAYHSDHAPEPHHDFAGHSYF